MCKSTRQTNSFKKVPNKNERQNSAGFNLQSLTTKCATNSQKTPENVSEGPKNEKNLPSTTNGSLQATTKFKKHVMQSEITKKIHIQNGS